VTVFEFYFRTAMLLLKKNETVK